MKTTKLLTTVLLLFAVLSAGAQTDSKGFRFQGFADTPEGEALKREAVTVRFTIYPKTGMGFVFVETQEQVTDNYGIFYANVGEMNTDDMQKLNFGNDYWMKVEVKKTVGGVYSTISDTELVATPYARHAANGVPVGTIMAFGGVLNKIPEGWLLCDGTEYDGEDPLYEQLYETIGTNWGGSGTAFNVPELRGNFVRGLDKESGNDPEAETRIAIKTGGNEGDKVGSYQADEIREQSHGFTASASTTGAHAHIVNFDQAGGVTSSGSDAVLRNLDGSSAGTIGSTYSGGSHTHSFSGTTLNVGGVETRPENVSVAYIIKY